ncbi:hypothetical protein LINGRAHAP2_LOCUS13611, partial [Linum grandiflorum]
MALRRDHVIRMDELGRRTGSYRKPKRRLDRKAAQFSILDISPGSDVRLMQGRSCWKANFIVQTIAVVRKYAEFVGLFVENITTDKRIFRLISS